MTATRLASLAVVLAIAAAGCGSDDDGADQFREDYNAAVERLNQVNTGIEESGQNLSSKSGAEISEEFTRIADTAGETHDRLQNLDPPEEAKDEFDELLQAVDQGVKDIRATAQAAKAENPQRFVEAAEALSETGEEIEEAERALKRAVDR